MLGVAHRTARMLLVWGASIAFAGCGGTVTNVGSIGGDAGATDTDSSVPPGDGSIATTDAPDADTTDARATCAGSQCIDLNGTVLCEGDHGSRACPGSAHTEICTCGGTAPSHWTNCGGCL